MLVGETHVFDLDRWAAFYGNGEDELHLAFNFLFLHAPFSASALHGVVEGSESRLPPAAGRCGRAQTTTPAAWPPGGPKATRPRMRLALMMLLTLRGTPVLYYGDEIGLPEVEVAPDRARDVRPWAAAKRKGATAPAPHALDLRSGRRLHHPHGQPLAAPR